MIKIKKADWYEDERYVGDASHSYPCLAIPGNIVEEGRPIKVKVMSGKYKGVYKVPLRQYWKAQTRNGNLKLVRINEAIKEEE